MSYVVKATAAPRPKTKNVQAVSLTLAAVFVVLAVAQLFTFEKFPDVITDMWLPGGEAMAPVYAALVAVFEVGAVPFLLSMRLSPLMRIASMVSGWLAIAIWFGLSLWQNMATGVISNSGLFGATVKLPVGWWTALFSLALGVLAAWAAWGMWPFKGKHRS